MDGAADGSIPHNLVISFGQYIYSGMVCTVFVSGYALKAASKTFSGENQLCTSFTASNPLGVRKHSFEGFPCN